LKEKTFFLSTYNFFVPPTHYAISVDWIFFAFQTLWCSVSKKNVDVLHFFIEFYLFNWNNNMDWLYLNGWCRVGSDETMRMWMPDGSGKAVKYRWVLECIHIVIYRRWCIMTNNDHTLFARSIRLKQSRQPSCSSIL
jgi:hypothetical protein